VTGEPPRIRVNGAPRPLGTGGLAELVREMGLEGLHGIAVAVNGAVIPRTAWAKHVLAPGDDVEVVGAVHGG